MRRIKVGDRVQAFLNTNIIGVVTNIEESKDVPWMVGGTASIEFICELKIDKSDKIIRCKMHELHHVD
tara:strand:- start:787 stop:990 length:204 start_codon:yes stop_codon:yes gene_type:complete